MRSLFLFLLLILPLTAQVSTVTYPGGVYSGFAPSKFDVHSRLRNFTVTTHNLDPAKTYRVEAIRYNIGEYPDGLSYGTTSSFQGDAVGLIKLSDRMRKEFEIPQVTSSANGLTNSINYEVVFILQEQSVDPVTSGTVWSDLAIQTVPVTQNYTYNYDDAVFFQSTYVYEYDVAVIFGTSTPDPDPDPDPDPEPDPDPDPDPDGTGDGGGDGGGDGTGGTDTGDGTTEVDVTVNVNMGNVESILEDIRSKLGETPQDGVEMESIGERFTAVANRLEEFYQTVKQDLRDIVDISIPIFDPTPAATLDFTLTMGPLGSYPVEFDSSYFSPIRAVMTFILSLLAVIAVYKIVTW